jgi:hypothetical protein
MTPKALAEILAKHGVIDRHAVEDPEGYDGGATMLYVWSAADEITELAREKCQWSEDGNGAHETQCGQCFEFTHGGVQANGLKYCCFCGGAIVIKNYELV